jgi:hypothetical protein
MRMWSNKGFQNRNFFDDEAKAKTAADDEYGIQNGRRNIVHEGDGYNRGVSKSDHDGVGGIDAECVQRNHLDEWMVLCVVQTENIDENHIAECKYGVITKPDNIINRAFNID